MSVPTPAETLQNALNAGRAKAALTAGNAGRLTVLSIMAGAYIALGGLLSVVIGFGFPEATAANPALQRLLSGLAFPIGLTLIVLLGGELFTGNNAVLMPPLMERTTPLANVLKNWTIVWCGNFVGALAFTWLLAVLPGITAAEPWHTAVQNIAVAKTTMPWFTVFLRAIGANWCVCLALWLAFSSSTLTQKVISCWIPVAAFVALGYEHSIANMFFIPLGMAEGAPVTIGAMFLDNLVPATLGNIAGGALLVGALHTRLHAPRR